MRNLLIIAVLLCPLSIFGQTLAGVNGDCQIGGQQTLTSGLPSTGTQQIGTSNVNQGAGVQASFPSCNVTVYATGTTTKVAIYSNNNPSPSLLSNPFTANTDGSYTFFTTQGACYDILISSGSVPLPYSRTLADVCIGTGGGSGGGITLGPFTVNSLLKAGTTTNPVSATCTDDGVSPTSCSTGLNLVGSALLESKPNNSSTGTTANLLVARDSSGNAINAQPTDTNNIIGVAAFNAGTTGSVTFAVAGNFPLMFDNQTGIGDYVTLGSTSQGHDSGAIQPAGRNYGRITSVNAGPGTLANVDLDMSSNGGTESGGSGIVSNCSIVGGVFFAQSPGTTATCDPLFTTDGAGNAVLTSVTTQGASDGNVQIFDENGQADNSLNITSSGGDSEIDWLDSNQNVIGDIAFRSAFGNVRLESHAATSARIVSYVIISDPTEIASTCALGIQEGCILIDSLNTNFAFSAGLAANHSGGAMWQGDSTGRTWVGVPDNAGNNFIFWPLQSGTVALTSGNAFLNGVSYSANYSGSTVDVRVNSCLIDAATLANGNTTGICDATGETGAQTIATQINVGDSSEDPVTLLLPVSGVWSATMTGGTSCALKQYGNTSIIGAPASGLNKSLKIQPNAGSSLAYIYCTDTGAGSNYFYASGFTVYNQTAAVANSVGMHVGSAVFDSSTWQDIYVLDAKDNYGLKVEGICCSATFRNMQIDGEYGTGVTPLWVNQGGQGVNFVDLSVVKPGSGQPLIKITDSLHKMTVNFTNIYSETSNSDTTTALYQFAGAAAININGVGFHSNVASNTSTAITVDNSYNTMLTVRGLTMGPGAGTFTYPAQAVTDNNLGYSVPTNTAGNLASYPPPGYGIAVTAESYGASPSASTTVNTTAIQAALNAAAGGEMTLLTPGTFQINGTLVLPTGGNVHVRLGPNTKLKEVTGGTGIPVLVNAAYNTRSSTTAVTLTWSSGINFNVAWTAHGVSVGQYVWLSGSTPSNYNGVFQVISVVDANNFTVDATRAITGSPSGSAVAKVCDQNIIVEGGIWDYNFPTNTDPATATLRHAVIIGVAEHVTMRDMKVNNSDKYTGEFSAIRDLDIENWGSDFTNSDIVKIYGPAYNVQANHVWGRTGDDGITVQPNEGVAFAAYVWSGGGDIQGVHISNVAFDAITGTACVGAYGSLNEILDDVQIDTVACQFPAGSAVAVSGSTTTNNVKNVMAKNISGDVKQYLVVTAAVAADNIDISGITVDPLNPFSGSMITVANGAVVGSISIENTDAVWTAGSSSHLMQNDGTIGVITMDGVKFNPTGTAWNLYFAGSNAKTTKFNLHHINMTAGTVMLQLNGTSTVPNISITDSTCTTCTSIISSSGVSFNASMARNVWTNASGGVIRSTGTPTINYQDFGSNLVAGSWQVTASGTPVLTSLICDIAGNCTNSNSQVIGATATTFGASLTEQSAACETTYGATTLATGATTTDTGLNCLPANSIIDAVVGRVTTTITASCTGWELGDATTAARFSSNNTTLTAGTITDAAHIGTFINSGIASATTGIWQASAAKVRITCAGGNPGAGAVRVIVFYHTPTAPTS